MNRPSPRPNLAAERAAQGLPLKVEDPQVLAKVAAILTASRPKAAA